jgi:hypothetical protein
MEIFNPHTQKYTQGPAMNNPRKEFGICVLKNKIYVFGGFKVQECEVFHNNKWTPISPLNSPRIAVKAVAIEGGTKAMLLSTKTGFCSSLTIFFTLLIF